MSLTHEKENFYYFNHGNELKEDVYLYVNDNLFQEVILKADNIS